jgi:hypothetical protein
MTPFEFIFALISIITSLALTNIIAGVVVVVRHGERGGMSLSHALWMWIGFAVVVGNWGALWSTQVDPHWPLLRVSVWLLLMTSLYAFCALVVPEVDRDKPLNLRDFHEREGRRYILVHNVFALLALLLVLALSGVTAASTRYLVPSTVAFALGTVALFTRGRVQLAATVPLALLAAIYMVVNLSLLSTGTPQ